MNTDQTRNSYAIARKIYADLGVDTDTAIDMTLQTPLSVHCWQGDDLTGFISGVDNLSDGGIIATGNFPGKAKNGDQLREDMSQALRLIPGKKKVSLHAVYAESKHKIDLSEIDTQHFSVWIDWAKKQGCGLDFNPTCFSHHMAAGGYTLASKDPIVRKFWVEHVKNTRRIAAEIGKRMGQNCVNNIWIPDGAKDTTVDKIGHRRILLESLDEIFSVKYDEKYLTDTVESKLFGIGSESFVAGSHEFYLLYAQSRGIVPCMDMGHFHPTESVSDKLSAMLLFFNKIQIHTSRGVRWDSDHVAVFNDELTALLYEVRYCDAFDKMLIALDYFDGSINRLMAWAVGARATRKAILSARLMPLEQLKKSEDSGSHGRRLAMLEDIKALPLGAVWNQLCERENTSGDFGWIADAERYEEEVLLKRE